MSFWENKDSEENDEEGLDEDEEFKSSNDRIIFLIDARESMYCENAKGERYIANCLRVVLEVMKTKVVAQDSSSIGITLFGSNNKDTNESTDHVYTLFSLAPPNAQRIRQLKDLIENFDSFVELIGSQPLDRRAVPLKQALWTCSQSFATKDLKKSDLKRIWLFTNDDNPNGTFPVEQNAIVTVARDCAQAGIEISLWHMNRPDHVFDPTVFFTRLLVATSTDSAESNEVSIDHRMLGGGFDGFDTMMASVRRKEYRKRRLSSMLFSLGTSTAASDVSVFDAGSKVDQIGVQIFKMIQIAKKPLHQWLYGRSNEPLKSVSRFYDAVSGETLESENISTYVDVAGNRVPISKDEMTALKKGTAVAVGPVGDADQPQQQQAIGNMKLLYCISKDVFLSNDLNVDTPYFLYPDEKTIEGSNVMFEAFLRECASTEVIPIVKFAYNRAAVPRAAALYPQLEVVDEDGCQVTPPGFHVIPLPFAEDIRFNPLPEERVTSNVSADVLAFAGQVVDLMDLGSDFCYTKDIENPSLQQFYSILQSVALNESDTEFHYETDDKMRPSEELLNNSELAQVCKEFANILGLSDDILEASGSKVWLYWYSTFLFSPLIML
jgi:ATP-dependent DNA helicase 2 subunit 1